MVELHTMIEHEVLTNDFSKIYHQRYSKGKVYVFTDASAFNFAATSIFTSPSKGLVGCRRRITTRMNTLPIKIVNHRMAFTCYFYKNTYLIIIDY